MRVVFMGTPEFAVPSLRAVASRCAVVAVYTRPDAVSGRGSHTRPSPVSHAASDLRLSVRTPSSLKDGAVAEELARLAPDVIVVAAYGLVLPPAVLEVPALCCLNVHASLLPRWRGAAPIHRAILAGDLETGVSIMRMEEGLDTGPYCVVKRTEIDEKSVAELTLELSELGALALVEALDLLESGRCEWIGQDDAQASYADKVSKSEVALSPHLSVADALRRIRASSSQAAARAVIAGRDVAALAGGRADLLLAPGEVTADRRGVVLGFSDGALLLTQVRPSGKSAMRGVDWARGLRLSPGGTWSAPS